VNSESESKVWKTISGAVRELNTTGVAKYSDFGPIDGYISETVQDYY